MRGDAVAIDGGRTVTVSAPRAEIPLFVRAGARIPLLPPDVDTLAGHGSQPGLVHLSDRADALGELAFPE